MKIGNSGSQFQLRKFRPMAAKWPTSCLPTMALMFIEPLTISTTTSAKPMAIS